MLKQIFEEYERACKEHPEFSDGSIDRAVVLMTEEVGEVAKAVYEHNYEDLKKEIAQVITVGYRFLEMLEDKGL